MISLSLKRKKRNKEMKNIFSIFVNDLKSVARNIIVFIVIIGISVLPALYAWFNIAANWDPYSSTGGIPFAVCSNDKGAAYNILLSVNAGDKIIDELKKNDKMGWDFVDEQTAVEGVKSGKYYAAVVIPEEFSEDLMSVLSGKFKQAELHYYINEKENAIAPKITAQGIRTIEESINSTYVNTVATMIASTLNLATGTLGGTLDTSADSIVERIKEVRDSVDGFKTTVDVFISSIDTVGSVVDASKDKLPNMDETLLRAGIVTDNIKGSISSAKDISASITDSIESILTSAEGFSDTAAEKVNEAFDLIEKDSAKAADLLTQASALGKKVTSINNSVIDSLGKLDSTLGVDLADITDKLDADTAKWEGINEALLSAAETIRSTGSYTPAEKEKLGSIISTISARLANGEEIFNDLSEALSSAEQKMEDPDLPVKQTISDGADMIEMLLFTAEMSSDAVKMRLDEAFGDLENNSAGLADAVSKASVPAERIAAVYNTALSVLDSIQTAAGIDLSAVTDRIRSNAGRWENIDNRINSAADTIRKTGSLPEQNKETIFELIDLAAEEIAEIHSSFSRARASMDNSVLKMEAALISASERAKSIALMMDSAAEMAKAAGKTLDGIFAGIEKGSVVAADGLETVSGLSSKMMEAGSSVLEYLKKAGTGIDVSKLTAALEKSNKGWEKIESTLADASAAVRTAGTLPDLNKDDIIAVLRNADKQLSDAKTAFGKVKSAVNAAIDKLFGVVDSASALLESLSGDIPDFSSALDDANNTLENIKATLENVKTFMDTAKTRLDSLANTIESIKNNDAIGNLINPIIENPQALGDYISSPAKTVETRLFPVDTYGSGMTPFYSSLAFWVGGIILVAVMRTDLKTKEQKRLHRVNQTQMFFGRYLIFFMLGQIQALIISLGDLFFLKIQCENPALFIISSLISSFVYTLLIYSLTITFSVIGKALAVIILVIQIAGSGGTFPIEVLPGPFQAVSPFLPFKYGINMLREAVAGVDAGAYVNDLLMLLLFVPAALLLGLLLRRPCIGIMNFFNKRIEQSDIVI